MTMEEIVNSTPLRELVSICPITFGLYGVANPVPDPDKIASKLRGFDDDEIRDAFEIVDSRLARLRN